MAWSNPANLGPFNNGGGNEFEDLSREERDDLLRGINPWREDDDGNPQETLDCEDVQRFLLWCALNRRRFRLRYYSPRRAQDVTVVARVYLNVLRYTNIHPLGGSPVQNDINPFLFTHRHNDDVYCLVAWIRDPSPEGESDFRWITAREYNSDGVRRYPRVRGYSNSVPFQNSAVSGPNARRDCEPEVEIDEREMEESAEAEQAEAEAESRSVELPSSEAAAPRQGVQRQRRSDRTGARNDGPARNTRSTRRSGPSRNTRSGGGNSAASNGPAQNTRSASRRAAALESGPAQNTRSNRRSGPARNTRSSSAAAVPSTNQQSNDGPARNTRSGGRSSAASNDGPAQNTRSGGRSGPARNTRSSSAALESGPAQNTRSGGRSGPARNTRSASRSASSFASGPAQNTRSSRLR